MSGVLGPEIDFLLRNYENFAKLKIRMFSSIGYALYFAF